MSIIYNNKVGGLIVQQESVNFSTAKQKYTFSRGNRFPANKQDIFDLSYELPSQFSKRAPSFGVGHRFHDPNQSVDNPSPGSYRIQSEFDQPDSITNKKSLAFSFGISRQAYEKVYQPSLKIPTDRSIPGPGTYTLFSTIGKEGRKFSLQGRTPYTRDVVLQSVKQGTPGPGNYEPKTGIDKIGRYTLSNFSNSKAATFAPKGIRSRFQMRPDSMVLSLPGPGAYDPEDNYQGNYILSTIKNMGVRKFGTEKRMHNRTPSLQTPGPGSYRPPSDFGYVENLKASPRILASQHSPRLQTQQNATRNLVSKQDSLKGRYMRMERQQQKEEVLSNQYAVASI